MKLPVTPDFIEICKEIVSINKTLEEWRAVESSDYFQTESYCGGFEALEDSFCFSYYDIGRKEYWFQLTLEEVGKVISGELPSLSIRPAYAQELVEALSDLQ